MGEEEGSEDKAGEVGQGQNTWSLIARVASSDERDEVHRQAERGATWRGQ